MASNWSVKDINNKILAATFPETSTNVKIWSISTRKVLFEEDSNKVIWNMFLHSSSSWSLLVIILKDEVELLKFQNETLVSINRCFTSLFAYANLSFSSFVFPHVLIGQYHGKEYGYSISVWNVAEKIFFYKYLHNIYNVTDGNRNTISEASYVSSSFVIATSKESDDNQWTEMFNCIIKVVNDDGELIREIVLDDKFDKFNSPLMNIKLHFNGNWLLVEHLQDCVFFKLDLKELLDLEAKDEVPCKKLNQLQLESDLFYKTIINRTSISCVHIP